MHVFHVGHKLSYSAIISQSRYRDEQTNLLWWAGIHYLLSLVIYESGGPGYRRPYVSSFLYTHAAPSCWWCSDSSSTDTINTPNKLLMVSTAAGLFPPFRPRLCQTSRTERLRSGERKRSVWGNFGFLWRGLLSNTYGEIPPFPIQFIRQRGIRLKRSKSH